MEVKKLTEAAMLSALFVVLSVVAISCGLGYFGYIDFIVPSLICIVYLRCGYKYAFLSSICSLLLIIFVLGDIRSGILMSQSMMFGLICALIIPRKESIIDDLFIGSILACIVMLIIDYNFSKLIGYSIITQGQESLKDAQHMVSSLLNKSAELNEDYLNSIFYITLISLPFGTMIITYILSILLGRKFKFLNENAHKKFIIIRNFRKYGSLISCSKEIIIICILFLCSGNILLRINNINNVTYINVLINSLMYISYFFLLQDSLNITMKSVYIITKSSLLTRLIQLIVIMLLFNLFKITFLILLCSGILSDYIMNIRKKQNEYLQKYL